MKNRALLILFSLCLIPLFSVDIKAQIHDFDSLVKHSDEYKQMAEIIADTLDLFNDSKVLNITLESDFKNLVKRKFKDEYQEAIITLMFSDSVRVTRNIKIKPRGHMRKNTCHIPPLKLNFPKKQAFIKQLQEFDKMKIVLDCKKGNIYEQYILLEYYTYKIQNIISDYSLRARLVSVKHIDTSGKYKESTRFAILLEHIDQLAERHGCIRIETKNIRDLSTDRETLTDAYLFQYLVGNTDWSIPGMHNIYMLKSKDPAKPKPYVVPYDFDYAGVVDALYAVPNEQLGTESVRERVYRGVCLPEADLINAKERILKKKQDINQLIQNDQLLDKRIKQSTVKYLNEFFLILENQKLFSRDIVENCR